MRNAPSTLEWFRNDLTLENINMLQVERLQLGRRKIELCQNNRKDIKDENKIHKVTACTPAFQKYACEENDKDQLQRSPFVKY